MFLLVNVTSSNQPQILLAAQVRDIVPSSGDSRAHPNSQSIVSYWTGKETTGRPNRSLEGDLADRLNLEEADVKVPELFRLNVDETVVELAEQMADLGLMSKKAVETLKANWHDQPRQTPRPQRNENPPPARVEYRDNRQRQAPRPHRPHHVPG